VDGSGVAQYEIAHPVAWDYLEWNSDWQQLSRDTDAVCFGSLAQRSNQSRATIGQFLKATPEHAVKIFDVNLRQSYYTAEILSASMQLSDIVKLNEDELPTLMNLLKLAHKEEKSSARTLLRQYGLQIVCITRGSKGSLLVHEDEISEHAGFQVRVADTVGSGDAFTAGLVHEYLHGAPLDLMNEVANLVGAWVASEVGAMPAPKRGALEHSLADIR
jgi:fructokinase